MQSVDPLPRKHKEEGGAQANFSADCCGSPSIGSGGGPWCNFKLFSIADHLKTYHLLLFVSQMFQFLVFL
jgi:hypothetical protein